jgi:hypothetical protein
VSVDGPGPVSEAELVRGYGARLPASVRLRNAAAQVTRWTYVPDAPSKRLELASDQAEAFPGPWLPDPSVEL